LSVDINRHHLSKVGLFQGMSNRQIDMLAGKMRGQNYGKDEIIIREGEVGGELFILLKGTIEISKQLTLAGVGGGDQRDKNVFRICDDSNEFFGEMSMFGSEERSATVRAITDTKLGMLTQDQVQVLAKEDPSLGYLLYYNIGHKIAENMRRANQDILKLTTAFVLALEGR
jgi:CRP/FNR family cyclic AMP-dependent transcriptional regulator